MQLVQAADATVLAGVSTHQLREWCSRRSIIEPDVPGAGRGRHALFSWQTILAIRLLNSLRQRFGVEVGAWAGAMEEFRRALAGRPFAGLWRSAAAFPDSDHAWIVDDPRPAAAEPALLLPLAPHLQTIAESFALPPDPQMTLFPAVGLRR